MAVLCLSTFISIFQLNSFNFSANWLSFKLFWGLCMFWLRGVSPYSLALLLHFFVHSHESLLGRNVSKTCYFIKVSVSSLMRHSLLFLFLLHFHFGIEFFYTGPLWPAGDTVLLKCLSWVTTAHSLWGSSDVPIFWGCYSKWLLHCWLSGRLNKCAGIGYTQYSFSWP